MRTAISIVIVAVAALSPLKAQFFQQGPALTGGGQAVSISSDGNTAIVGAADSGAWIYTRTGGVWYQGQRLVGTGESGGAPAVAISPDGNTAMLGDPGDGFIAGIGGKSCSSVGAAWVFTRANDVWTQQGGKLVAAGGGTPSLGRSVALSADGNTAIMGGTASGQGVACGTVTPAGSAVVYSRTGGVWSQQASFTDTGAGESVALSGDGNTAILGSSFDQLIGAAYVYTRDQAVWSLQAKLVGTGAVGFARQGSAVAVSGDGNTAIVGGDGDNAAALMEYGAGAAWIFARTGSAWTQQGGKLVAAGDSGSGGQGGSVAISNDGNTVIVGGPATAEAWVYTHNDAVWSQAGGLLGSSEDGGHLQGPSVALSGDGATALTGFFDTAWAFTRPGFFTGEQNLGSGVYFLTFPDSTPFGSYTYFGGSFLYHYDLGFEYVIPGNDPNGDIYFFDFASGHWWYTGAALFPNIYDFALGAWIYYFIDPANPGHYTTNPRKFAYDATHATFTM